MPAVSVPPKPHMARRKAGDYFSPVFDVNLSVAIATTIAFVLLAAIAQRTGHPVISAFVAAAAWLSLAAVCLLWLMNAWL